MSALPHDVWITGIGLVSSQGEGLDAHWDRLARVPAPRPVVDEERFAPYPVHPLATIDVAREIPKTSDQRQMEQWQRTGVYAAGLALADAGIAGNSELLNRTDVVTAAGNGERDLALDARVLEAIGAQPAPDVYLNRALATGLRPTLYLGQLSNLLAGNISLVHKATGSSRTFKGEEMAGVAAVENAVRRIAGGEGELFLVGGALNAEREDLLLGCELDGALHRGPFRSVWARGEGGGLVPGSIGVFLVLESEVHAALRGAKAYASLRSIASDRAARRAGSTDLGLMRLFDEIAGGLPPGPLAVLSGVSGVEPVTGQERAFLQGLEARGYHPAVRAHGTVLGHALEAHFIAGVALAALAVSRQAYFPPFDVSGVERPLEGAPRQILVTGLGHWRGEGLALVEAAD
ncbi:MAG: beta-ketoacyl-ACP synthase [Hyphomicrobiaceae bacterium]|nr:beta-ketoacyl-ACP synthase [Hyphomicrobiaceae bacterium]